MNEPHIGTSSGTPSRGFSLVEVMVAVVIICVGLLGIAKMQALSLSSTTTARLRSLAAFEAASLASAMHANRAYWANGPPTTGITVTSNPLAITSVDGTTGVAASADLASAANISTSPCVGVSGAVAKCTPDALAEFDLALWAYNLNALLPNPTASIACNIAAPAACTINIGWSEQAVAMSAQQANAPANTGFQNPTYTLYVEP